jgi:hypothetical protein
LLTEATALNDDLYESHFRMARLLRRLDRHEEADAADAAGDRARTRVESTSERPR